MKPVTRIMRPYDGSSYIALQASTGQDPTNPLYWSIVAQRGSDGTGTAGPVGMNWRGTYGSTVSYGAYLEMLAEA